MWLLLNVKKQLEFEVFYYLMFNAANVVNPEQQVNDVLKFLIAHFCASALSWLLHVPEIYCSNPEELNCLGKRPLSVSKSSNRVNNLVGFSLSIALAKLIRYLGICMFSSK